MLQASPHWAAMRSVRRSPPPPMISGSLPPASGSRWSPAARRVRPRRPWCPAPRVRAASRPPPRGRRAGARWREVQAEGLVLAAPPTGAESAEGAASGEYVEGRGRLRDDARRAEGRGGAQRAELELGAERSQGAEGHPRLRDRVPRAADLRDLDQVVHQRDAGEPGRVGRPARCRAASPSGSSPQGKRETWSSTRGPSPGVATGGAGGVVTTSGSSLLTTWTSQPSVASSARTSRIRCSWAESTPAGTGRSRAELRSRHVAAGVSNTTATAARPARVPGRRAPYAEPGPARGCRRRR